jgi:hypothetical protein
VSDVREQNMWLEVGPGAARGEVIRVRNFANGSLAAVVVQTKGYKPVSVTNPDPRDDLIVMSERTISLTFLPGVRMEMAPVSSSEAGAANPPTPPRTTSPSSPVPAQVVA